MVRRLGPLLAILGAAVVLVAPQAAYAAPADNGAATTEASVYYDPVTHPVPRAVAEGSSVLAPMATGGGCTDTYGGASCISYTGSTKSLNADFYVTGWDHVTSGGNAFVYIIANGSSYYRYSVVTSSIGHYPVSSLSVGSGSGSAYTVVDFYDQAGNWLMSINSPTQWYP